MSVPVQEHTDLVSPHYDQKYWNWQESLSEFAGLVNQIKFEQPSQTNSPQPSWLRCAPRRQTIGRGGSVWYYVTVKQVLFV
jgi:hypothetical protein